MGSRAAAGSPGAPEGLLRTLAGVLRSAGPACRTERADMSAKQDRYGRDSWPLSTLALIQEWCRFRASVRTPGPGRTPGLTPRTDAPSWHWFVLPPPWWLA